MRIFYSFLIIISGFSMPAAAQFVSHDFEPVAGTSGCTWIKHQDYSTVMKGLGCYFGDTLISGDVPGIYLLNSTCDEGPAHSGSFFIGLAAAATKSDRISLKLADPSQTNRKYSMVLHIKKPKNSSASETVELELGYSFDCDQFGTLFETVAKPTDTLWDTVHVAMAPPEGTKYITINAKGGTATKRHFTYIDDVQLIWSSGVDDVIKDNKINIYPNPFNNSASISINDNMVLPCRITMHDVTGRKVYEEAGINTRKAIVNKGNLNAGMYILELSDSKGNSGRTRIMID